MTPSTFDISHIRQIFQKNKSKLTTQRQIILQVFLENQSSHLSAEDVHLIVKQQSNDIGLATVYRTLELLNEMEILQKMDFGDGRNRYELNETDTPHHHHHLICLDCGIVIEFEDDLLDPLEALISKNSDFTIIDHKVKFYGYCRTCQDKRES